MKLKYVRTEYNVAVFGENDIHRDVARGMHGDIIGAGFVFLKGDAEGFIIANAHGESISLGVKSNGDDDSRAIEKYLNRIEY